MNSKHIYLFLFLSFISVFSFSQKEFISCNNKKISYEGRTIVTNESAQLIWSGTSVTINFKGTNISGIFKDEDTANYYNVMIDKDSIYKIHFDTAKKSYDLVTGLPYGKHTLQIFKRTEWDKGKTWFYGFETDEKTVLLAPPAKPKRKIEFFGNSITCGYAIEDYTKDSPNGFFENNYNTYAALTARHFNAQYHCISKSGIGVMVSWFPLIMPEMYNRIDPTDSASKWDFKKYIPDIVVINLFQNDSWIVNNPNNAEFKHRFGTQKPDTSFIINSYKNFVQLVRKEYPKAKIICMLGTMDITRPGSPWPGYVKEATAGLHDKNVFTFFIPYKNTFGHPKTAEQKAMADLLIDFIEKNIHW